MQVFRRATLEHLLCRISANGCFYIFEKRFAVRFSNYNLAKGTFDKLVKVKIEQKYFLSGEERKDTYIRGKQFWKSFQNSRKFWHYTSALEQNIFIQRNKKGSKKRCSMNFKSSRTEKSKKQFFCKKQKTKKKTEKNSRGTAQVFSSEFCKICKNSYFVEHLRTAAQVFYEKAVLKNFDASLLAYY